MKDMIEELQELTELLLVDTEYALKRYEQSKSSGEKGDFYAEVKPFADKVHHNTKKWGDLARLWLTSNPQRNLHPNQINATEENLEMVCVQAFFPETSRKRFMAYIQSIKFVLTGLQEAVMGNREDD